MTYYDIPFRFTLDFKNDAIHYAQIEKENYEKQKRLETRELFVDTFCKGVEYEDAKDELRLRIECDENDPYKLTISGLTFHIENNIFYLYLRPVLYYEFYWGENHFEYTQSRKIQVDNLYNLGNVLQDCMYYFDLLENESSVQSDYEAYQKELDEKHKIEREKINRPGIIERLFGWLQK